MPDSQFSHFLLALGVGFGLVMISIITTYNMYSVVYTCSVASCFVLPFYFFGPDNMLSHVIGVEFNLLRPLPFAIILLSDDTFFPLYSSEELRMKT